MVSKKTEQFEENDTNFLVQNIKQNEQDNSSTNLYLESTLSQENQQEQDKLSKQDIKAIIVLTALYFIQGIPLGFFQETIPYILAEKGLSYSQLGIFSLTAYPFAMKLFFAPFEDAYFFKKIGKRKTYIIPLQYILALILFFSQGCIDEWVENQQIIFLTILGVICNFIASLQDIAVDGWVLTLLDQQKVGWGSVCQNVGQILGIITAGPILIQLNSVKFSNQFIFKNPQEHPLINLSQFFIYMSFLIFLLTLVIHFFIKEKNPTSSEKVQTVCQVIKQLRGFFYNKNLLRYVTFMIFWRVGFQFIQSTCDLRIIKMGFPKEILTTLQTIVIPLSFICSVLVGKYVKQGKEMTVFFYTYWARFLDNIYIMFLLMLFNKELIEIYTGLILLTYIFGTAYGTICFVNQGAFNNRISDESLGGTYLSFLNSISNFGSMWTTSFALFLIDYINFETLVLFGQIYIIIYYIFFKESVTQLQEKGKEEWKLKSIAKINSRIV